MGRLLIDFQDGLLGPAHDAVTTTLTSPDFADLPAVGGSDFIPLVLGAAEDDPEIVWVTAHTAAADTVTVTRGQEGSAAAAWGAGTTWALNVTKMALDGLGVSPTLGGGAGTEVADLSDDTLAFGRIATNDAGGDARFTTQRYGGLVAGYAFAFGASYAELESRGYGAQALGSAFGNVTNAAHIYAGSPGATAAGYSGGGTISATGYGAEARGSVYGGGTVVAGSPGSAAFGYANRGEVSGTDQGAFAHGAAYAASGATTRIEASGRGSGVSGFVRATVSGANGLIEATNDGGFAGGRVYATNGDIAAATSIRATHYGAFAFGEVRSYGTVGGRINAGDRGATAFGRAYGGRVAGYGRGSLAVGEAYLNSGIYANGHGSFALGRAIGGFDLIANFEGSFALGKAAAANIVAGAVNAVQLGEGTNDVADSISVAGGVRIHGGGAPGVPRNGDIWVASGHVYARTNGVTKNLSNIT